MTQALDLSAPQQSQVHALLSSHSARIDKLLEDIDWRNPEIARAYESAPAGIQAEFDRAVEALLSVEQAALYRRLPDTRRALEPLREQPDAVVRRNPIPPPLGSRR